MSGFVLCAVLGIQGRAHLHTLPVARRHGAAHFKTNISAMPMRRIELKMFLLGYSTRLMHTYFQHHAIYVSSGLDAPSDRMDMELMGPADKGLQRSLLAGSL